MNYAYCLFALLILLARGATAQIDTTGGQFHQPLYRNPAPSVTNGVPFGAYVNGQGPQALLLDVYQPVNGPTAPRPLVILAHGGGFIGGSRADYDVTELCQRLARLGYVTASIDYRLESFFGYSGARAVVNAVHDLRAAVRFFRQDAATANAYNINPDYIFVGGSSAGAITAVHVAYLDQEAELAAINAPGVAPGLEGNSGSPGYSSAVRAAINLCGAVGDLNWLQPGDEPLLSLHGTLDGIVPYGSGMTFGNLLHGSGVIKPRADAVGVANTLKPFKGAGHVPYNGSSPRQQAYMDTTFWAMRDFLRPLLVPAATLPVTLVSFEAERQGAQVLLRWQTAEEVNSAGFEVEVSGDGRTFRALGFVPSRAAHGGGGRYAFRDAEAGKTGLRYYRLRQLDLDGTARYHGLRIVDFRGEPSGPELSVWPNPTDDQAAALITTTQAATARLLLRDALGRVVLDQPLTLPVGATRVALPPLATRPAGVYTLELRTAAQRRFVRLLRR